MTSIVIGATNGEHLAIDLDIPNEGWVCARVEISVDGFRGQLRPCFELHDLQKLKDQLEGLYKTLSGNALFEPREKQLTFELKGTGLGRIGVQGEAYAHARFGNCLKFEFAIDQTFLPKIIRGLSNCLTASGGQTK